MKSAPNRYPPMASFGVMFVFFCVIPAAILYWLLAVWPDTPDGWIHLQRVRALADAMAMGRILPRWFPDFSFGYGYPVFNFYAPAFYYPPALLSLAGVELVQATRVTLALCFGLSGLGMALFLRTLTRPHTSVMAPILIGTVAYLFFPYRLYDLFVRGALPEFAAFLWPPFIAYFSCQAYHHAVSAPKVVAKSRQGQSLDFKLLAPAIAPALCWSGLILTHNLTALMCLLVVIVGIPVISGWMLYTDSPEISLKRYGWMVWQLGWRLCVPVAVGALLSAWYWLPALMEARWVGIGASESGNGFLKHMVDGSGLLTWLPIYAYAEASAATVPLPGWLLLVLLVSLVVLLPPRGRKTWWMGGRRRGIQMPLFFSTGLLLCTVWLTMRYSEALWRLATPVLGKLQFPWRWQTLVALACGVSVAMLWASFTAQEEANPAAIGGGIRIRNRLRNGLLSSGLALYLLFYGVLGLVNPVRVAATIDTSAAAMWAMDAEQGQVGASWTGEFLPMWVTEQRWAIGRAPSDGSTLRATPALPMRVVPTQIGYDQARYRVSAQQGGTLTLARFFYPAWRVTVDGAPVTTTPVTNLALLAFDIAAGEHVVDVSWQPTAAVWGGRLLTLLGWLAVLAVVLTQPTQWWRILFWVLVGVGMLLVATSVGAKSIQPHEIDADFGDVNLGGADIQPVRVGEVAAVRLHWFVRAAAEPLNAYVHVLGADGQVVAQDDGLLAGDYRPPERWLPGLLFDNTHLIPLASELPPGSYRVMAGLYPAGQPDSPLIPDGATEPRVEIGLLEVRP